MSAVHQNHFLLVSLAKIKVLHTTVYSPHLANDSWPLA